MWPALSKTKYHPYTNSTTLAAIKYTPRKSTSPSTPPSAHSKYRTKALYTHHQKIFSKLETKLWPNVPDVSATIKKYIADSKLGKDIQAYKAAQPKAPQKKISPIRKPQPVTKTHPQQLPKKQAAPKPQPTLTKNSQPKQATTKSSEKASPVSAKKEEKKKSPAKEEHKPVEHESNISAFAINKEPEQTKQESSQPNTTENEKHENTVH